MVVVKKAKLLYVLKILKEQTDEQTGISLPEILTALETYGICAERKSIYDDINTLIDFGFPIEKRKQRRFLYHYTGQQLSGTQVALLDDALKSAAFVSEPQRQKLFQSVSDIPLQEPEASPLYCPDQEVRQQIAFLYEAIFEKRCISFERTSWQIEKKKKALKACRKLTELIILYPLKLVFCEGRYVVAGISLPEERYCHYDIRTMQNLADANAVVPEVEPTELQAYMRKFLPKTSAKQEEITIECARYLFQDVMTDFFVDSEAVEVKSGKYDVCITGSISLTADFYAKLFRYEDSVRLLASKKAVETYKGNLKKINKLYKSKIES